MHLLLGHADDPCCSGVLARLEARGLPARIVHSPLAAPARLAWRFDAGDPDSRLALFDTPAESAIDSVLVRGTGWLDPAGWDPADHAYMQAEVHAAMLAWLAGLSCPVVNRPDAARWYRARPPLLAWRPLLRRCGLVAADVLVTNDPAEARAFGLRLAAAGQPGAVYTPLTLIAGYPVTSDADWHGLAALQAETPVCLTEPHGAVTAACVIGETVVWDADAPAEARALAPAIRAFAVAAGLACVEVGLAPVRRGLGVVAVDPMPELRHFGAAARERILDGLAGLLVAEPSMTAAVLP